MNFNNLTVGNIVTFITSVGIIVGFLFKTFIIFSQVKKNQEEIEILRKKIQDTNSRAVDQKTELLKKVEETNSAVNLLCSAISAIIDSSLDEGTDNLEEMRRIKRKLDERKEII